MPVGERLFVTVADFVNGVGSNGKGKSSIPIILEELLFNKNSKGIKKADIQNRYTGIKGYSGFVDFIVDGTPYRVEKVVASTARVKLFKDGLDISGHTTTQTYKQIEAILGMEYATATKIIYQSLLSSLDFLSSTDAVRKKFLVSL